MKKRYRNLLFLTPLIAIFAVFIVFPFFRVIQRSFFEESLAGNWSFVGLKNYIELFQSETFRSVTINTLEWTFGGIVLKVGSGLIVALLLNRKFKFKGWVMLIVLIPWAIPYSVSHIAWRWLYNALYGHINGLLIRLHLIQRPITWLSNPQFSLWGVLIANSWTGMPFCAYAILSALYSIPKQRYEAASIDGANAFQSFRYITLPAIRPVLTLVSALAGIWTFTNFSAIWLMTKGGPAGSSTTFIISIYKNAFDYQNPGYASAISVVSAVFLFILSSYYIFFGREGEEHI